MVQEYIKRVYKVRSGLDTNWLMGGDSSHAFATKSGGLGIAPIGLSDGRS